MNLITIKNAQIDRVTGIRREADQLIMRDTDQRYLSRRCVPKFQQARSQRIAISLRKGKKAIINERSGKPMDGGFVEIKRTSNFGQAVISLGYSPKHLQTSHEGQRTSNAFLSVRRRFRRIVKDFCDAVAF